LSFLLSNALSRFSKLRRELAPTLNKQTAGAVEPKTNSGGRVCQLFDPHPSQITFKIFVLKDDFAWTLERGRLPIN
jgi:hypothetical protein